MTQDDGPPEAHMTKEEHAYWEGKCETVADLHEALDKIDDMIKRVEEIIAQMYCGGLSKPEAIDALIALVKKHKK